MDNVIKNIRTAVITTETGKDVTQTQMISGQASDSLSGKNSTVQYTTSGGASGNGPFGGLPSNK